MTRSWPRAWSGGLTDGGRSGRAATLPPRLLVEERRRRILELVDKQDRVTVDELVRRFGVSAVTVRGDLDTLSRAGAVERSHGGEDNRHSWHYLRFDHLFGCL